MEKENDKLEFPDEEVLHSSKEKEKRKENLYLGMILGNNYQRKVVLSILTKSGFKDVGLPIRAITEDNTILAGGIKVPLKCIREVRIS